MSGSVFKGEEDGVGGGMLAVYHQAADNYGHVLQGYCSETAVDQHSCYAKGCVDQMDADNQADEARLLAARSCIRRSEEPFTARCTVDTSQVQRDLLLFLCHRKLVFHPKGCLRGRLLCAWTMAFWWMFFYAGAF